MNGDTWPYRVRVRPYKHFRHKEEGGTFGDSAINVDTGEQSGSGTNNTH